MKKEDSITRTSLALSYLNLRRAIGFIGILLPFVLVIGKIVCEGNIEIQQSISDYYYTCMRDIFVGSMCAIGVFFFSCQGYDKKDATVANLASLFAIGVALFPTIPEHAPISLLEKFSAVIHYASAIALFLTLAYFSLVLFRKTDPNREMTKEKRVRNLIYTLCGTTILVSIALGITSLVFLDKGVIEQFYIIFWLESIAIIAFSFSWLIKGGAILRDKEGMEG
jgi:uncharacterized membrane protein YiaA